MFQVKSFLSIVASCINRMRSVTTNITDYNVGSVARTLIEAPAQEIDELYQQMLHGLVEAIPVSVYSSFNFPALAASPATGLIRVTITANAAPVLVPGGTAFVRPDGAVTYAATADTTIAAGNTYADVPVAATTAGTLGNLVVNTSFSPSSPPPGFVSAINLAAFTNATDAETAAQQKTRFQQYIQTLARATDASLKYAATQKVYLTDAAGNIVEKVGSCAIIEPYKSDPTQPTGLVYIYIHNGVGGTSQNLVQFGQQVIDGYYDASGNPVSGYKAAGTKAIVAAAPEQPLNISAGLTVGYGYDQAATAAAVQSALYAYVLGIPLGQPFLGAKATQIAMETAGVLDFNMTTPGAGDVAVGNTVKLMPGSIIVAGGMSVAAAATPSATASLTTAIQMDAAGTASTGATVHF